jgi:hypothetical protein
MKASKHKDDNLFKDPGIQYQKETITENITLLDYFLDLIDKSFCFVCLRPVSCVAYVDCILDGPILTAPSDYLMFNNFFNKINNFIVI